MEVRTFLVKFAMVTIRDAKLSKLGQTVTEMIIKI